MTTVSIEKHKDAQWGNCVRIANEMLEMLVTVDFGPRVIHLSRVGMENMMYQDFAKTTLGEKQEIYDDHLKLCGGHRLWIAPEVMPRCYYPDSEAVAWEIKDGAVIFTAPVEKVNLIQKSISIKLAADEPVVELDHAIKNCGVWDIDLAHWCITMLDKGGKLIIPTAAQQTGYLPNRIISLWDYSEMNDERVYWGKDFITLRQDTKKPNPFKLGLNNECGWAAYFNKGQVFFKYFDPYLDACYPDNGCCFESYTNGVMLECESLSQFVTIEPGAVSTYAEEWELHEEKDIPKDDENEIAQLMSRYITQ